MLDRDSQIEYLLEHYQNPRNHGEMPDADVHLKGGHEGCADVVTVYLKLNGDKIEKISFTGEGCTISQAATSILTEEVQGLSTEEVQNLDYSTISELIGEELVKTRPRCATLGLDTLKAALQEYRKQQILGKRE
jgi:nitrogen fixation protein NifU and related proteins